MRNAKHIDSPNIKHYAYAYSTKYGKIISHENGSVYEGAKEEELTTELDHTSNSVWKLKNNAVWYQIDTYNNLYDIIDYY